MIFGSDRLIPRTLLGVITAAACAAAIATPETPGLLDPETQTPGLAVGEPAPDAMVKTAEGDEMSLADLYADGPVIVTFYRGGWCPFCTKALAGWEERMDDVAAMGATFVAITPEKPEHAASTQGKHAPSMMIVSDASGEASRAYRVAFAMPEPLQERYKGYGVDLSAHNANGAWELPAPGTFVIDRDGVITYAWADWDYKKRADPDEVLEAARKAAE